MKTRQGDTTYFEKLMELGQEDTTQEKLLTFLLYLYQYNMELKLNRASNGIIMFLFLFQLI